MGQNYKYSDITGAIIGSAMEVHSDLGNGFPEVIYQRSLAIELKNNGINFNREVSMPLYYKGKSVGKRRADFLVEEKVLVELKAISEINETHYNQILNYLTAFQLEIGLLINFGENSLNFKRFINSNFR
ncbi:GxxExxY protein [Fodinibius salsisoli]|uniref:GxxExxY protein n=1 Tax=Fodinibius salsisoli TaxID=2820877 RepID=A0ABT3PMV6_9BACT|nr:GxxExxY protein [Fodinibius salsisoli]MCW9707048.1 GxxExxY protein [Fodinibius salsisoli]